MAPWHKGLSALTLLPDQIRKVRNEGPVPLGLHLVLMSQGAGLETDLLAGALRGIDRWRTHPFTRPNSDTKVHRDVGSSRLLDYGGKGRPVLLVPSLVNPFYILDLLPGNSLVAYLRERGLRPFLVDWGVPGPVEQGFTLADYIERMTELGRGLKADFGAAPDLLGYCMGGTLALAAALLEPETFSSLSLLAAPWDFHKDGDLHRALALASLPLLPIITAAGMAPPFFAQSFFAALSPRASLEKFAAFSEFASDGEQASLFVALEDWVNGGASLAGPMAVEVLRDWYCLNVPGQGLWSVAGKRLSPGDLNLPCFAAVPMADRIVPPSGALGLAGRLKVQKLVRPEAGHVGMIVGRQGKKTLWKPLADWLLKST